MRLAIKGVDLNIIDERFDAEIRETFDSNRLNTKGGDSGTYFSIWLGNRENLFQRGKVDTIGCRFLLKDRIITDKLNRKI